MEVVNFSINECVVIRFVNLDDVKELLVFSNVRKLAEMFRSENQKT
jgi:hypothetical protein